MDQADIERIIRSLCSVYIRSKEGRTIDTDALDEIRVDGIELAAKEIAALAAAQRVAGQGELTGWLYTNEEGDEEWTNNESAIKALGLHYQGEPVIPVYRAALALSPGTDMDELCAACGGPRREHVTPGGTRYGPTTLCGVFIPRERVSPGKDGITAVVLDHMISCLRSRDDKLCSDAANEIEELLAALAAAGDRTAVSHDQREPESLNDGDHKRHG